MVDSQASQGRMARQRRRKPGDLAALQRVVWQALLEAEAILRDADSEPELKLRGVHAVTQAASAYARLIETGELEARVKRLEERRAREEAPYA